MCDGREFLDVEHIHSRVGDCLAEKQAGIVAESGRNLLGRSIRVDKRAVDAVLLERHAEQVECSSVNGRRGDDVAAGLTDVADSKEYGGLTRRGKHCAYTAFQSGNLGSYSLRRGILQPCIEKSGLLEVKQPGHLLGSIVFESCTLIDRQYARLSVLRLPTALHTEGLR